MRRIRKLLTCFLMVMLCFCMCVPVSAKADVKQQAQHALKINKSGYTQKKLVVKSLPSKKGKTIGKIKVNTEIQYKKINKTWGMIVYKKHVGFIKVKDIKSSLYTPGYFKKMGVINYNSRRWTWYSQRVLPGGGLKIPGRHVDERGFVCDQNNYICLASNNISYGSVIDTPFGKRGKIYDSGCSGVDVYVNW